MLAPEVVEVSEARDVNKEITLILESQPNWKGALLGELRAAIRAAHPDIVEGVKWKMPSKPLGSPTWERGGILCVADYLKSAVRITFPQGASIVDPTGLFNARLDSKTARAIDFAEGATFDREVLTDLVRQAASSRDAL